MLCFGSGRPAEGQAEGGVQLPLARCQARDPGAQDRGAAHLPLWCQAAVSVPGTGWDGAGRGARGQQSALWGQGKSLWPWRQGVQFGGIPGCSFAGPVGFRRVCGRGLLGPQSMLGGLGGGGGRGVHSVHETSSLKLSFPSAQKHASHTEGGAAGPGGSGPVLLPALHPARRPVRSLR